MTSSGPTPAGPMGAFCSLVDESLLNTLKADPEHARYAPNKSSREVTSGHYVPVLPTKLPAPELVATTPAFAGMFGLDENALKSDEFLRFFSGDQSACPSFRSWATPYALSIYGKEYMHNCPFGTGNGYGDGRAVSVAEVLIPAGTPGAEAELGPSRRWEFQLKGGGTTPFCRGADGRAVIRSSVREFLASEAMHNLGVSTTRAVSLVVSTTETSKRAWYSGSKPEDVSDETLAQFPANMRDRVREQLKAQQQQPDRMVNEKCAITTRVAPSFLRIGQLELFGRRARLEDRSDSLDDLRRIVAHAMDREYPDDPLVADTTRPFEARVVSLLDAASRRISQLTADWIRVGFVQGNFNGDNCLVGGRTMDYGPFGFVEKFSPLWNMWSGGGEHFGFLNQHMAGVENFKMLIVAVRPLLADHPAELEAAQNMYQTHHTRAFEALEQVWRRKLGLARWDEDKGGKVIQGLLKFMAANQADWTLLWRQLATIPERTPGGVAGVAALSPSSDAELLGPLEGAFYKPLSDKARAELGAWVRDWAGLLVVDGGCGADGVEATTPDECIVRRMRQASPKYVPREWMLREAYTAADRGDYSGVHRLQAVFRRPYDEQPENEAEFYRKAPAEVDQVGGVAFMT